MHSTTFEMIVEDYLLSQSRSMLVRPQFWLRAAQKERSPDVLGVHMRDKVFYLAEVTSNQRPTQLLDKLKDYKDGEQRILAGLKHEFDVSGKWSVVPWLFIWEDIREPLKSKIAAFGVKTTSLKDLITPPLPGFDLMRKDWGQSPEELARLLPEEIGGAKNV
jgi:hypothetical protein